MPFTRLSETIKSSEDMCQFPTMKLHATTCSEAECIQVIEAAQGGLGTPVTWKVRPKCHSDSLTLCLTGEYFYCCLLVLGKNIRVFKYLDGKTKFRLSPHIQKLYMYCNGNNLK